MCICVNVICDMCILVCSTSLTQIYANEICINVICDLCFQSAPTGGYRNWSISLKIQISRYLDCLSPVQIR